MKLKSLVAFFAGAAGFLLAAAAVWLFISVRSMNQGGDQPELVPDRIAAVLFSMAFGSAVATGGFVYVSIRRQERRPLPGVVPFLLMVVVPFLTSFALLLIAHSQLRSMQFTNRGDPVSPWGYLYLCGGPVVVGLVVGVKLVDWFSPPKEPTPKP